jgi:hypothetical protein
VDGPGEIGEEGLHRPGGVGDLLRERFEPYDLVRLGVPGERHLAGPGEITGRPGVDEVRGDAAAPQQPPPGLQGAQFAPPGEIAGRRAVRLQAEQGRAPAAYGEARLGVEEGGAGGGRALGTGELGLERAEAQLGAEDAVAVLVHQ